MTSTTTKPDAVQPDAKTAVYLFDDWFDPIEAGLRDRVRDFIETMFRTELDTALARPRYARRPDAREGGDGGWQPNTDAVGDLRIDRDHRAAGSPQGQ